MNRNIVMKFRATEEEAAEIRRKAAAAGMNVSCEKSGGALQHRRRFRASFRNQENRKQHQPDRNGGELQQGGVSE